MDEDQAPKQAERGRTQREDAVTRLHTELDRIAKARAKTPNGKTRTARRKAEAAHTKTPAHRPSPP